MLGGVLPGTHAQPGVREKLKSIVFYMKRKNNRMKNLHEATKAILNETGGDKYVAVTEDPIHYKIGGVESKQSTLELINKYKSLKDECDKDEFLMENVPMFDRDDFVARASGDGTAIIAEEKKWNDKKPARKYVSTCCGTDEETVACQCNLDDGNHTLEKAADDYFQFFDRKITKVVKRQKMIKCYSRLTNFLKIKFFMKARDRTLINTMVNDARIWMLREKMPCDTEADFLVLTQSVMAAFMINEQEMKFRQYLKQGQNYDNMVHLNKTLAGDLGKTSVMDSIKRTYAEHSSMGGILKSVKLPTANPLNA
jgi:hypothetical protein